MDGLWIAILGAIPGTAALLFEWRKARASEKGVSAEVMEKITKAAGDVLAQQKAQFELQVEHLEKELEEKEARIQCLEKKVEILETRLLIYEPNG